MPIYLLIFSFLLFTGCATIISGTTDDVSFDSIPSGAELYIDGEYTGKTPITVTVSRNTFGQKYFTIRHDGYDSKRLNLVKSINVISFLNCTSWPLWSTDALTGAMILYQPHSYFIELNRNQLNPLSPTQEIDDDEFSFYHKASVYFTVTHFSSIKQEASQFGGTHLEILQSMLANTQTDSEQFALLVRSILSDNNSEHYLSPLL